MSIFKRHPNYHYRGGGPIPDRSGGNLDRAEATHWLLHSAQGAALVQRTGLPVDQLADLLVEAASRFDPDNTDPAEVSAAAEQLIDEAVADEEDDDTTNKKATNMTKEIHITEVCKAIGSGVVDPPTEHALASAIKKQAAASRLPNESAAAAFSRIVCDPSDDGVALRKALQLARGF
jgi:hypothetical protein